MQYLGHESAGYRDVADRFDITISTLYEILTRVINFLIRLAPQVIKFPTMQEKEETIAHFLQQKQFPGVIGIIYFYGVLFILLCYIICKHYI